MLNDHVDFGSVKVLFNDFIVKSVELILSRS